MPTSRSDNDDTIDDDMFDFLAEEAANRPELGNGTQSNMPKNDLHDQTLEIKPAASLPVIREPVPVSQSGANRNPLLAGSAANTAQNTANHHSETRPPAPSVSDDFDDDFGFLEDPTVSLTEAENPSRAATSFRAPSNDLDQFDDNWAEGVHDYHDEDDGERSGRAGVWLAVLGAGAIVVGGYAAWQSGLIFPSATNAEGPMTGNSNEREEFNQTNSVPAQPNAFENEIGESDAVAVPVPGANSGLSRPSIAEQFRSDLARIESLVQGGDFNSATAELDALDPRVLGYGNPEFSALRDQIAAGVTNPTESVVGETQQTEAQRLAEEAVIAEEKRVAEQARLAEQQRQIEERVEAERIEAERVAAEQARAAEAERVAAEAARVAAAERAEAEAARVAEQQRLASEQARLAEAERLAGEAARQAEAERVAAAQAIAAEAARIAAEQQAEVERQAAAARIAAQQEAEAALQAESERLAAEQARAAEAARIEAEQQAEAARQAEAERQAADASRQAEQAREAEISRAREQELQAEADRVERERLEVIASEQRAAARQAAAQRAAQATGQSASSAAPATRPTNEDRDATDRLAATAASTAEAESTPSSRELAVESYPISDQDFELVYKRFFDLKTALEQGDINGVSRFVVPEASRMQDLLQLFSNSRSLVARLDNVSTLTNKGIIVGTLTIDQVVRRNGNIVPPPASLKRFTLTSRRDAAGWSKIQW